MQSILHHIYPPRCLCCETQVTADFALCGPCWRETRFLTGLVCDRCGAPLPGQDADGTLCDDCLTLARPWARGRAALAYSGNGRKLVLALKHGDRQDIARPAGRWLFDAARPILRADMLVAPIPLHRWRLFRRRFNQAALLSAALARRAGVDHCPDLLCRPHPTPSQEGRDRAARFANLQGAFTVPAARVPRLSGRSVLLVDDVMTSGATFAAAAEACRAAGAASISVLALARVAKEP